MTHPKLPALLLVYCFLFTNIPVIHASPIIFRGVTQTDESDQAPHGLKFRLSEVPDQPAASPTPNIAPAQTLSVAETNEILKALPPIVEDTDDKPFRLRERTMPPPRTGKTTNVAFPAREQMAPPGTKSPALEVVRYAPQGSVPIAPALSITFSQPMVALSSLEEAAAIEPVNVSPRVEGKWRWLSPTTLVFEAQNRFPMATDYAVSVPAGIKSAAGSSLRLGRSWSFNTPAPTIKNSNIAGSTIQARDKIIFIEFDQRINPADVLKKIKLSHGNTIFSTRLATMAEIESDEDARNFVSVAQKDRWIAFRAINKETGDALLALPAEASISVSIEPGTPSAEGPKTTTAAQKLSFQTFGPMRLVQHICGSVGAVCSPEHQFTLIFNNQIDEKQFKERDIRIEPAIPGATFYHYGPVVQINGTKKPNTRYTVTVNSLIDAFGQDIDKPIAVTFTIGPAVPRFRMASEEMTVVDPAGPASIPLFTTGVQKLVIELYAVQPEDWPKFARYKTWLADRRTPPEPPRPGTLVFSRELNFPSSDGTIVQTDIDLSPGLKNKLGHVVLYAKQVTAEPGVKHTQDTQMVWVQSTRIGLAALVDREEMVTWASSLTNGAPLANVQTRLLSSNSERQTGLDGLARLELPAQTDPHSALLIARLNDDVAVLPERTSWYTSDTLWQKRTVSDSLAWYVFDDRALYRPGEQVHVKGWVRRVASRKSGDLGSLGGAAQSVDYVVKDARGNEIAKGTLPLNTFGAFDSKIVLPATMNLGKASLKLELAGGDKTLNGRSKNHEFDVQEFRRPEFEINAKAVTDGPFFIGDHADVVVSANYFAGGPLPSAPVTWNVAGGHVDFTPPNRDDFNFGQWSSWWDYSSSSYDSVNQSLVGQTSPSGTHRLRLNFDSVKPAYASRLTAEASVTDVNRQTWTSSAHVLVHPASVYVGLRSKKMFVQQGEPLVVESIVTDLDGKAVAETDISMTATQLEWKQVDGNWQEVEAGSEDCKQRSGVEVTRCTFASKEGGAYRVTATVRDSQGRRSDSEIRLWVAGGKKLTANVDPGDVEIIPQAKEYKPGDVAEVMIQAPFYPAEGLMTLGRSGIVKSERFTMEGPTHTLRIPIVEEWTPNINVRVDLVGLQEREASAANVSAKAAKAQKQPAYATGDINLSIPPIMRRLSIAAVPRETILQPGGTTTIDVEVKNAAGEPERGSEVAVVVVDEAVLAMTDYKLKDPLTAFYQFRDANVDDYHSRAYVLLSNVPEEGGGSSSFMVARVSSEIVGTRQVSELPINARVLDGADISLLQSGPAKPKISLRRNFDALAAFSPSVRTDTNGRAQVQVKLPDNLTRYRIMAVAVDATKRFGTAESAITARSPLMVRPSAPRFLNFGDRFELPVVIQNQTDHAMTVDMAARATNAGFIDGDSEQSVTRPAQVAGRRVTVPANNRVELRIPAAVTRTGTARFQVAAVSGNWSDAAEVSLPVWTPATTEAFAAYGQIDEGTISQPVKAPANVFVEFGGLEIQTSSTQLQELTDAFLYLQNYPYECSEQIASRIISVAALRDVLSAFKAKDLPSPAEIEAAVARDLKLLQGMQNSDGGYGFWTRNEQSWPFLSLHVAHALARAKEKKFAVPEETLNKSRNYLRNMESNFPKEYPEDTRRALKAYALYVRAHMNDVDPAAARKLIKEAGLENLSLEAVGWLLYVLSGDSHSLTELGAIRNLLNNKAVETAGAAHFVSSYKDGDYLLLHSNRRGDGIILEALIKDQPTNQLIPKIVRGLLAHRTKGRWENTQENAFILLALDRYFETYEKTTPNFTARVWLGQSYAGEQLFRGRSTDRQQINVPMSELARKNSQQELILAKDGPGRLYYRLGMQYAPSNLSLKPADYGFVVQRSYESIDKPDDLKRDADGTWRIKAGARIRVRVKMIAPTRRYHVALVDPLPAGFETLNPELAVTGRLPAGLQQNVAEPGSPSYGLDAWRWNPVWFEHQNFRDERAEAFASLLWDGVYNYSYVVRATTPGMFIVPPAKAEEMYHPETFGRGGTDRVIIE